MEIHYDKQHLKLFNQLSELLHTQYQMPPLRSNEVGYYGANAAVFKQENIGGLRKGPARSQKFYGEIRKISDIPFDVDRVSQLN